MKFSARPIIGMAIWLLGIISAISYFSSRHEKSNGSAGWVQSVAQYSTSSPQRFPVSANYSGSLSTRDPVFMIREGVSDPTFVGYVSQSQSNIDSRSAESPNWEIVWSESSWLPSGDKPIDVFETPDSLAWVLQTMLPPEKRQRLQDLIIEEYQIRGPRIAAAMEPVIRQTIRDLLPVLEVKLKESLKAQRADIEKLAEKYQGSLLREEIIPLLKDELMPIVRREASPLANEIGIELWEQASLWRFGWRAAYDWSFLPQRDLVRGEWERFLETAVMPTMEEHTEDFIEVLKKVLTEASANERMQQAARDTIEKLLSDPDLRGIFRKIITDTVIDNPELRSVVLRNWDSPAGQKLMAELKLAVEPVSQRLGAELFGTAEDGLTPEFTTVLRSQILGKDRRWLVVQAVPASSEKAVRGGNQLFLRRSAATPSYPLPLSATE